VEISIPINVEPIFYWTVIAYLILLFHSFNIEQIERKMGGVETLFISGAIGAILYVIFSFLNDTIITVILSWVNYSYLAATQMPFTFNPFLRELHQPFTTSSEYFAIGLFLISILIFIVIGIFFVLFKVIRYCLDPNDNIFCQYRRFTFLREYKISKIFLGIPFNVIIIGLYILMVSLLIGFITNISTTESPLKWWLNLIMNAIMCIFMLVGLCYNSILLSYEYQIWKPFLVYLKEKIHDIQQTENRHQNIDENPIIIWAKQNEKWLIIILLVLVIILTACGFMYDTIFPHYCTATYCVGTG
jgi:hypothetical protein